MSPNLIAGIEPIAGYTLIRPLGRGGFGEVWEATAPGGVRVALKFIRLDTAEAVPEQRALAVIRNIRHPHLLDVQFAVQVDDCLVLAMPLCDRTLMDRLRECRAAGLPGIPRDELLGYMDDLARAVDFLNEPRHDTGDGARVGIQHRDIKPHNVFLVGDLVRLADFGLAKVLAASAASHTGAMSPNYVAPEVIEGRVSAWSDQYSLAVTYVQMRTARQPFAGDAIPRVLYKHLNEPPDVSGLPVEEQEVVGRALAKRPEERWPTCRAFAHGLRQAALAEDARRASSGATTDVTGLLVGPSVGPEVERAARVPETQTPRLSDPQGGRERSLSTDEAARPAPRRRLRLVFLGVMTLALAGVVAVMHFSGPNSPEWKVEQASQPPAPLIHRSEPPDDVKASAKGSAPRSELSPKVEPPPVPGRLIEKAAQQEMPKPAANPVANVPKAPRAALAANPPVPEPKAPRAALASRSGERSSPHPPTSEITSSIGMKLVLIPLGEFLMGSTNSDKDAFDDEKPAHRVRITRPFYLGATEVTQGEYRKVMGDNPSYFSAGGDGKDKVAGLDTDRHPVEQVSWNDAVAFCNKLSQRDGLKPYYQFGAGAQSGGDGYRLPTEAEWEYACRAGSQARYAFGDDDASLGEYAWFVGNSDGKTHPVGQKNANRFGLFDMHGNLWEWCWDGYDGDFYKDSPAADHAGPSQATDRVSRGGGWKGSPRNARSANRYGYAPGDRGDGLGFRVARVRSGR